MLRTSAVQSIEDPIRATLQAAADVQSDFFNQGVEKVPANGRVILEGAV